MSIGSTIGVDESKPVASVAPTAVAATAVVVSPSASVTNEASASSEEGHLRDLLDLIKPRISSMVLVTVALAVFVASEGHPDAWILIHCLIGTALVAASSGAFNQWLERATDARMKRTQNRPLPAGRMSGFEVIGFGVATLIAGTAYLAFTLGSLPALWAVATWLVYVCVYTPMKQRTNWNTTVGAVSGALPILIGASAVQSTISWQIAAMLSVLFLWQFPHFIAIAWIYRNEYAKAGLQMVTTTDPSGRKAGIYSVLGAILVLGASFLPLLAETTLSTSVFYTMIAAGLGVYQLRAAYTFQQQLDDAAARKLLKASIIYLPLALGLIAVQTAL